MMGLIACDRATYRRVKRSVQTLGCPPGPDDAYLCLRGLRTLRVRMRQHESSALAVAGWLEKRPEVRRVMHPGLESHPQHHIFMRDFKGSSGLFSFQLDQAFSAAAVDALCDSLKVLFFFTKWVGSGWMLLALLPLLCGPLLPVCACA
jgi:cystathionine beta-lyase